MVKNRQIEKKLLEIKKLIEAYLLGVIIVQGSFPVEVEEMSFFNILILLSGLKVCWKE